MLNTSNCIGHLVYSWLYIVLVNLVDVNVVYTFTFEGGWGGGADYFLEYSTHVEMYWSIL